MLTEDYNGTCPKCNFNRMLVRYGSQGYYQYDACSKCGYAYGTNHHDTEEENRAVWQAILENDGEWLGKLGYAITRKGYHKYILTLPEPRENFGSVFEYKSPKRRDAHDQRKENNHHRAQAS